jgi:hypothetical protein
MAGNGYGKTGASGKGVTLRSKRAVNGPKRRARTDSDGFVCDINFNSIEPSQIDNYAAAFRKSLERVAAAPHRKGKLMAAEPFDHPTHGIRSSANGALLQKSDRTSDSR